LKAGRLTKLGSWEAIRLEKQKIGTQMNTDVHRLKILFQKLNA
jgi:hypothetical protein